MSIPKSFIDQVLDQTDIVDVVGRRVQLNKKGSNYWGVCPFHDDHKPSMAVNQDKQFYYCFVCQASGNSINFLRDYENLDFTDAVETLASSLGLEIPYEKTEIQDENDYSILDEAVKVFEAKLKEKIMEWEPNRIIIGKPLNMDGTRSDFMEKVERFAKKLRSIIDVEIEFFDERLTSFEARQLDEDSEMIDDVAAKIILDSWLNNEHS